MIRDVPSNVDIIRALSPQRIAAGGSANGPAIDTQQYDGRVAVVLQSGALDVGVTFKVQKSADPGFTSPTDVATIAFAATDDDRVQVYALDLESLDQRYVRVRAEAASGTGNVDVAALVVASWKPRR